MIYSDLIKERVKTRFEDEKKLFGAFKVKLDILDGMQKEIEIYL